MVVESIDGIVGPAVLPQISLGDSGPIDVIYIEGSTRCPLISAGVEEAIKS